MDNVAWPTYLDWLGNRGLVSITDTLISWVSLSEQQNVLRISAHHSRIENFNALSAESSPFFCSETHESHVCVTSIDISQPYFFLGQCRQALYCLVVFLFCISSSQEAILEALKLLPGVTGIILTTILVAIYTSATGLMRRSFFEVFWFAHHLFILFYAALIIHGFQYVFFLHVALSIIPIYCTQGCC